jgi:hypothetical protein
MSDQTQLHLYNTYNLSPDTIYVSTNIKGITKKGLKSWGFMDIWGYEGLGDYECGGLRVFYYPYNLYPNPSQYQREALVSPFTNIVDNLWINMWIIRGYIISHIGLIQAIPISRYPPISFYRCLFLYR